MFCKKCGSKVSENDKFCPKCGAAIGKADITQKFITIAGKDMTAEELVDFCIENKFINVMSFGKNLTKKEWRIFFENILDEIQEDENPLLCFAGTHNFKGKLNYTNYFSYVLTNRRLIAAGWSNSNISRLNPVKNYSMIFKFYAQKHPKCFRDSIYLCDVTGVKTGMVSSKDVIIFDTTKGSLNIMFPNSNVTHRLCDKINEVLAQIKEGR